jgi:lysophospholipase L1-like esterase
MSRHSSRERSVLRLAAKVFLIVVVATVVTLLAGRGIDRVRSEQAAPARQPQSAPTHDAMFRPNPTVLVITDSIGGGVSPDIKRYPDALGELMNWNVVVDAVGARGFLPNDLRDQGINKVIPPFIDSLKFDVDRYKADYIIVDGGRNDLGEDPARFAPAVDNYLTALRAGYPKAKIVVLLPTYLNPQPAPLYPMAADAVRRAAEKNGAYVLDPIAEGWFEVDMAPLLWTDGIHPNAAGATYYAHKIIDGMARLGVIPSAEPAPGAR